MSSHDNVFIIYHIMKVRVYCALMMLENDILFNLSMIDCVFVTYAIGNFEGSTIAKFHSLHTRGLLVLTSHPHDSLPLAHHSNLNPNGFLYLLPDPPTQQCCILHQRFPLHIFLNRCFFTSTIQKKKQDLTIHLLLLPFLVSQVHHPWQNWHSNLQVKSWTPSSCFV